MRCSCCDKLLSDKEATARFVPENKGDPPRYVEMCRECQSYLPDGITIVNRPDLDDKLPDEDLPKFDFGEESGYDYEE